MNSRNVSSHTGHGLALWNFKTKSVMCVPRVRQGRMANSSQEADVLVQQGPYRQTFKLQTSNDANLRSISVRSE